MATRIPQCEQEINTRLENVPISINYIHNNTDTAFIRIRSEGQSEVYRITVNASNANATHYLEMHEKGHILFGHCYNNELVNKASRIKIKSAFDANKDKFVNTKNLSVSDFYAYFESYLQNILMDFEVNSKLFTDDEKVFMNREIGKIFGDKNSSGMWPEDFNFPKKLTASAYLNLYLLSMRDNLKKLKEKLSGKPVTSDNWVFSKAELEKMVGEAEKIELPSTTIAEKELTVEEPEIPDDANIKTKAASSNIRQVGNVDDLSNWILKCISKKEKFLEEDKLYLYNRRVLNCDVITPGTRKSKSREISSAATVYILLDVSGSISATEKSVFCQAFNKIIGKLRKNGRLVQCDTQVLADENIKKIHYVAGGGNDLKVGVKYIKDKYHPSPRDYVFFVSDFYDPSLKECASLFKSYNTKNIFSIRWVYDSSWGRFSKDTSWSDLENACKDNLVYSFGTK
jgi:hypothetical protein